MIGKSEKFLGALCYIPFFFAFVLFLKPSPFLVFHIKQGFVLSFIWLIWLYLYHFIPFIGWYVIGPFGFVFLFFLTVLGMANAINGKREPLPFFGVWVERLRL
jgi:Predicted membrane protein